MPVDNNLAILKTYFDEWKATAPSGLTADKYFELFAAEQVIKNYDATFQQLSDGCVGGTDDGGIDSLYCFVNGAVVEEDTDLSDTRREPDFGVVIIQSKMERSYKEAAFEKLSSAIGNILDLSKTVSQFEQLYSAELMARVRVVRMKLNELIGKHPRVHVTVAYVTRGRTSNINKKVAIRAEQLRDQVQTLLPQSKADVTFLGAEELVREARKQPSYTLNIEFQQNPIIVGDSYVILARLSDYHRFIAEEDGSLRRYIFDWNVRDYQGNVEVNREIRATLADPEAPQFWWLNNGITIVCSKVTMTSHTMSIDDVQIVNGLQTSIEIFNHIRGGGVPADDSLLLCRLITETDPDARAKIIKATNSQTGVQAASLRAADPIQVDLEDYFSANGWFYDRRKNYYKNQGEPADRIVSIPYLAQAIMALGLGEPNQSRARPTNIIKNDVDYMRVFDDSLDFAVYLWAARTMRSAEYYLKTSAAPGTDTEKREFRFHLAMWLVARKLKGRIASPHQLVPLKAHVFSESEMRLAMKELVKLLRAFAGDGEELDTVAKGSEFVRHLFKKKFKISL